MFFFARFQTVLHVLSIVISLLSYYAFAITYNSMCVNCFGLPSSYWVIFHCFDSAVHWLVIVLTAAIAVLPRLLIRVSMTTLWPDDLTRETLHFQNNHKTNDDLLVAWSRSTSASSIYRYLHWSLTPKSFYWFRFVFPEILNTDRSIKQFQRSDEFFHWTDGCISNFVLVQIFERTREKKENENRAHKFLAEWVIFLGLLVLFFKL